MRCRNDPVCGGVECAAVAASEQRRRLAGRGFHAVGVVRVVKSKIVYEAVAIIAIKAVQTGPKTVKKLFLPLENRARTGADW